jgi:signal transduction histidine kinase
MAAGPCLRYLRAVGAPADVRRLLGRAGLLAWATVAAHAAVQGMGDPARFATWAGAFVAFGALYAWVTAAEAARPFVLAALAAQSACAVAMVAVQCRGWEGALLVLVALHLGSLLSRRAGFAWIGVQSVGLALAVAAHWSPRSAVLLGPPYFGFQVLGFLVVELAVREGRARQALASAHAELLSTRELLAESARLGERLRIARELHDAMGHHLAALSLNLEAVPRAGDTPALDTARRLTRRLLDDVEGVVNDLGHDRGVDLGQALRSLAQEIPRPRVHVEAAAATMSDPARAHVLLRCCQEVVTNAVKHADAANVWISIRSAGGALELTARDDGGGAAHLDPGNGLLGMRRRLEELGGALHLATGPGAGFEVRATLPR